MKLVAWLMIFLVAPATAAMSPDDFDLKLRIEVPSQAGLLRLKLPEDVYRAMRRVDLGDMRILNAAGETVPMARMPRETKEQDQRIELPLLPLPKVSASNGGKLTVSQERSGSNVRVEIDTQQGKPADEVVPGYLLEVKEFDVPINELILHWPEKIVFEAAVQISASDDLKNWRRVVRRVPVLAIGGVGSRILQDRVKLPAVKARYLRISWVGTAPNISLDKATLIHKKKSQAEERKWLAIDGKVKGNSIVYASPGLFPVDQIRLMPVDDSDVLPAILYSRRSVNKRWHWRIRTLGYRLRQNNGFAEGSPDTIPRTYDPLWRVDLDRGARSSSLPRLQLGWMPEEVVFVARGAGPYTLVVGSSSATPVWLAPRQVVPGFGTDKAAAVSSAYVVSGADPVKPVSRTAAPWQVESNWILWSALLLGVAVLGMMARGLWRDMRSDTSDSRDEKR